MKADSIKRYLGRYGRIRSLRGSTIRSTFLRVSAAFDEFDPAIVTAAMKALGQNSDKLTCVYCGQDADCWDHLVSAAQGGTHQIRNLAPACSPCNLRKGQNSWKDYLTKMTKDTPERTARLKLLEGYTENFVRGDSLISASEDQAKLADILERIHGAMLEADEIIDSAIEKRRKNNLPVPPIIEFD